MLKVVLEYIHESVEIVHGHCFDEKVSVMGEEEETSTLSHTLTGFEDTLNVVIIGWVQAFDDIIEGKSIFAS